MRVRSSYSKARTALGALIIGLWLVAASFMVVLSPPATSLLASATVSTSDPRHSHEYLVSIAEATRSFSLGDDNAPLPQGPDERIAFTPDVIDHLLDVRAVFIGALVAFAILTLALIVFLVNALRKRRSESDPSSLLSGLISLGNALLIGGCIPLLLCLILGAVAFFAFDVFFSALHALFFEAGTWQFSYDALLIRALPEEFWMGCAFVWAGALVVLCVLSIVLGVLLRRRYGRSMGRSMPR